MPEFECYNSNRIGGNGPNSGLAYHVVRMFTSPVIATGTVRILSDDDRPKYLVGIRMSADLVSANDKTLRIHLIKKAKSGPSILDPGVEVFRKFIVGVDTISTNAQRVYDGRGDLTRHTSTSGSLWIPIGIYMDETLDVWFNFSDTNDPVLDLHFITGNPDRLMEAQLSQNLLT